MGLLEVGANAVQIIEDKNTFVDGGLFGKKEVHSLLDEVDGVLNMLEHRSHGGDLRTVDNLNALDVLNKERLSDTRWSINEELVPLRLHPGH